MTASSTQSIPSSGWWCVPSPLSGSIPANYPAGSTLEFVLQFPQCWDGRNLDSSNHKSHMAYPSDGRCPSSHPVALTDIAYHVRYPVPDDTATTYWRLSSDMYGTDKPGGFSLHGDWFNGWDNAIQTTWSQRCNAASLDCGTALIGDGREIHYNPERHQVDPIMLQGSSPRIRPRN